MNRLKPVNRFKSAGRLGAVLAVALLAVACTSGNYADTAVPPKAAPTVAPAAQPSAQPNCGTPVASYQPTGPLPAANAMPAGSSMKAIQDRGRLIVGVSADTLLLGARNPISGQLEGFDIDIAKAVAQAIFGTTKDTLELRVISSAQRIPVLQNGSVDIVARNMTINCDRWSQIAFSTEYYHAGQKVLVPLESKATGLESLSGKKVCAPAASTSLEKIKDFPNVVAVPADTHTGCLVLFQQGKVDAITGDDTVLAGLAAQDPYAKVIKAPAFTDEPYGLGMAKTRPDLVRFVNGVLEQLRADGRWKAAYTKWLAADLGPAPAPPPAVYGRNP
ncbi:glutamate ABC transporter substrate-binding protein [Kribbella deserti]|uniref:Glutamate ABC transporter substrate-binding protein n=1 Tax=Kribbella deserti TaxID=1926257 RepID=A0ABV6QY05_9ACTN